MGRRSAYGARLPRGKGGLLNQHVVLGIQILMGDQPLAKLISLRREAYHFTITTDIIAAVAFFIIATQSVLCDVDYYLLESPTRGRGKTSLAWIDNLGPDLQPS
jgi:hypothetical protein